MKPEDIKTMGKRIMLLAKEQKTYNMPKWGSWVMDPKKIHKLGKHLTKLEIDEAKAVYKEYVASTGKMGWQNAANLPGQVIEFMEKLKKDI